MEKWRYIPGFEEMYSISNRGRVKSHARYRKGKSGNLTFLKERILKPGTTAGYLRVVLYKNGKQKNFLVHKLVLLAFRDPCPPDMECCHNDGNPLNNRLKNLRYDTRTSNCQDRKLHGTNVAGEKCNKAKLTWEEVKKIRRLYATGNFTQRELGEMFEVNQPTIGYIVRNETWREGAL